MKAIKTILAYSFEIAMLVYLLWNEHYLFAILAAYLVWTNVSLHRRVNHLRAVVRVYQVSNEAKLMALVEKAGVSEAEMKAKLDAIESNTPAEAWESLQADWRLVVP